MLDLNIDLERFKVSKRNRYYFLFVIGLFFYFYQYILRVFPGVIIDYLLEKFNVSAKEFSDLGSFYLYFYALLQIPIGILLDKYGIRKIFLLSILICILGTLIFTFADNFFILKIARIMQGIGSACTLTGTLKIVADYFPEGKRGFMIGVSLASGVLGAMACGAPLTWFIKIFGINGALCFIALFGALLFFVLLKFDNTEEEEDSYIVEFPEIKSNFINSLKNKKLIIYSIIAAGLYAPIAVFSDLWATGFLMLKYEMLRSVAAKTASIVYLGLFFGSVIIPSLLEKFICVSLKFILFFLFLCFSLVIFHTDIRLLTSTLFLLGFFSGAEMLCFTGGVIGANKNNSGIMVGVLNTLNMLFGGVLQQIVGVIIGVGSNTSLGTLLKYKYEDFAIAFSIILLVIFLCFLLSFKIEKE